MTADPGGGLEDSFTLTNGRLRGSFTRPIERHKLRCVRRLDGSSGNACAGPGGASSAVPRSAHANRFATKRDVSGFDTSNEIAGVQARLRRDVD
jgi:hypothetical protein